MECSICGDTATCKLELSDRPICGDCAEFFPNSDVVALSDASETVAMMAWDIEQGYKQAKHAMIEARDATDLLIQYGRKQALEELMRIYVQGIGQ